MKKVLFVLAVLFLAVSLASALGERPAKVAEPQASELIHEAAIAVKFGLTIDDIIDTVHVFPALSEGIKLAAVVVWSSLCPN